MSFFFGGGPNCSGWEIIWGWCKIILGSAHSPAAPQEIRPCTVNSCIFIINSYFLLLSFICSPQVTEFIVIIQEILIYIKYIHAKLQQHTILFQGPKLWNFSSRKFMSGRGFNCFRNGIKNIFTE